MGQMKVVLDCPVQKAGAVNKKLQTEQIVFWVHPTNVFVETSEGNGFSIRNKQAKLILGTIASIEEEKVEPAAAEMLECVVDFAPGLINHLKAAWETYRITDEGKACEQVTKVSFEGERLRIGYFAAEQLFGVGMVLGSIANELDNK